eukprot:scaffold4269_cov103-Isochrysis_galbana.AAC.3
MFRPVLCSAHSVSVSADRPDLVLPSSHRRPLLLLEPNRGPLLSLLHRRKTPPPPARPPLPPRPIPSARGPSHRRDLTTGREASPRGHPQPPGDGRLRRRRRRPPPPRGLTARPWRWRGRAAHPRKDARRGERAAGLAWRGAGLREGVPPPRAAPPTLGAPEEPRSPLGTVGSAGREGRPPLPVGTQCTPAPAPRTRVWVAGASRRTCAAPGTPPRDGSTRSSTTRRLQPERRRLWPRGPAHRGGGLGLGDLHMGCVTRRRGKAG